MKTTLSNRERQKKWKEHQGKKGRKQVTIFLSKPVYERVRTLKEQTGENFSAIINRAIQDISKLPGQFKIDVSENPVGNASLLKRKQALNRSAAGKKDEIEQILRDEISARNQTEKLLRESEERFRSVLENSPNVIYRTNLKDDTFDYISPSSKEIFGYTPEEMTALGYKKTRQFIHPKDYNRMKTHFNIFTARSMDDIETTIEYRLKHKYLGYRWMRNTRTVIFDENSMPVAVVGTTTDITERKIAEQELKTLHEELEKKVRERTTSLEETNTALKVLLKRIDEEKINLEDNILLNMKELVLPVLEKLKTGELSDSQKKRLDILEANLNAIISPLSSKLTSRYFDLTHSEIQVANLITQGRTTKEIAEILNLSSRTVDFHRAKIREKVGIKNEKVNLRSSLLSFQ